MRYNNKNLINISKPNLYLKKIITSKLKDNRRTLIVNNQSSVSIQTKPECTNYDEAYDLIWTAI